MPLSQTPYAVVFSQIPNYLLALHDSKLTTYSLKTGYKYKPYTAFKKTLRTYSLFQKYECEERVCLRWVYNKQQRNLSLQKELDKRIGKAATTFARLNARVWKISKLTIKTKVAVYNACVLSKLLYGSETWTTYSDQEKRLNAFHLRSLRRLLGISWMNKIPNTVVLSHTELPSMYTLLRQRRLRWLGHVRRMDDGRIPKDIHIVWRTCGGKKRRWTPPTTFS